jgi:sortase A
VTATIDANGNADADVDIDADVEAADPWAAPASATDDADSVTRGSRLRLRRPRDPRPQREPLPPLSAPSAIALRVAVSVAVIALWVVGFAMGPSAVQEQRAQQKLYAQFREALTPSKGAAIGGDIKPGTPVSLMSAPAIGLHDVMVVEGTTSGDLRDGPGHRRDTPLPGQVGVSVLMGRSVTYGAPFRTIANLSPGDELIFRTGQGKFTYRVMDVRRAGDPLPVQLAVGGSRVVLVTSEGSGWQRGWAPDHVVYVDAQLAQSDTGTGKTGTAAVPAPTGRPSIVPPAEQAMQGDLSALLPLVLWLQALVLVAIAYAWGRGRWGTWQIWLVSVPVLVAVVWGATDVAMELLPNLL